MYALNRMNSVNEEEAIKAISMKILDTVIEGKKDESSIDDILNVAFDQLIQTCPLKGGSSSERPISRRSASVGPLPIVSKLREEVAKEVERREQLPIIETKNNERKNETRLKEIEDQLCENSPKWRKIFIDKVSQHTKDQIRHSIAYVIVLFMAFKIGLHEADPTSQKALITLLLQAIVNLALQVHTTYNKTTEELYERLEDEKHKLVLKKKERIERSRKERAQREVERARMKHNSERSRITHKAITNKGLGSHRGGNRSGLRNGLRNGLRGNNTRKLRN